jgi:hypothetical protein
LFVKFFNNIIQRKFYLGVQPEVLEAIELSYVGWSFKRLHQQHLILMQKKLAQDCIPGVIQEVTSG